MAKHENLPVVLFVGDSAQTLRLLRYSFTVVLAPVTASSRMLRDLSPDCVVVDNSLPSMERDVFVNRLWRLRPALAQRTVVLDRRKPAEPAPDERAERRRGPGLSRAMVRLNVTSTPRDLVDTIEQLLRA